MSELSEGVQELIASGEVLAGELVPLPSGLGRLTMRDYQVEAVDAIYEAWREYRSVIAVVPTGGGKTVIAAETICRWPGEGRWLFIAHVRELIFQAQATIERHIGETPAIEMGMHREGSQGHGILDRARVLCASIQSLTRRLDKFRPTDFDGIIWDEFHHCHHPNTSILMGDWRTVSIEDIVVGDVVLCHDGLSTGISQHGVTRTFRYWYDGPLFEIVTPHGVVTVTPNHAMFTSDGKKDADRLTIEDVLLRVVPMDNDKTHRSPNAPSLASSWVQTLSEVFQGDVVGGVDGSCSTAQSRSCDMRSMWQTNAQEVARWSCAGSSCDTRSKQGSSCKGNGITKSEPGVQSLPFAANDGQESDVARGCCCQGDDQNEGADCKRENGGLWQHEEVREWRCSDSCGTIGIEPISARHLECRGELGHAPILSIGCRHYTGWVYDFEVEHAHNYFANGLLSSNSSAKTYRSVWEYFKTGNPAIRSLGITATPHRSDGISLKGIAEFCAYEMGIRDAIDLGWLVPIRQQYIVIEDLDFSKCKTVAKDLNEGDLEDAMMGGRINDAMTEDERREALVKQERMLHAVAAPLVKESHGRSGIVFCVTVDHATRMAEILRRYPGVTAEVLVGETPDDIRAESVRSFKAGDTQFLVGVGVMTEGFDCPNADIVAMARPTKSESLYKQMIGRGLRPLAGLVDRYDKPEDRCEAIANSRKSHCLVLDFVGNSGSHKLVSTADVLAGDMPPDLVELAKRDAMSSGNAVDIREEVWKQKQKRDEEELARQEKERQRQLEQQAREEARRQRLHAEAQYKTREINAFDVHDQRTQTSTPAFRGGSTDAQINLLKRLGISEESAMKFSKRQAGAVIDDLTSRHGGDWIMRFGKHVGQSLREIQAADADYFRWMTSNIQNEEFQMQVRRFRDEWRREHASDAR